MKRIAILLLLLISVEVTAQDKNWITNYKTATTQAQAQNQNMLVFVIDNASSETEALLAKELFNTEAFKSMAANLVLLKLNSDDVDPYNKRLAAHYTGVKTAPALSLVDANGNRLGVTLTTINANSIQAFISKLKAKLQ